MITDVEFKTIKENAKKFKYSNLDSYGELIDVDIICDDDKLILLSNEWDGKTHIYYAANNADDINNFIKDIKNKIEISFVSLDFVEALESIGFAVWCNWVDFFNNDIANTPIVFKDYNAIQFLKSDEQFYIKEAASAGADLSRGFTAEKEEWFVDWLKDNDIIIVKDENILVGICCVSIYDMDSGKTVWIRRIAVKSEYQGRGYGKTLMEQAIVYGINKGAKRGFLAADTLNTNAAALYKKCGFMPQSDSGEIVMRK